MSILESENSHPQRSNTSTLWTATRPFLIANSRPRTRSRPRTSCPRRQHFQGSFFLCLYVLLNHGHPLLHNSKRRSRNTRNISKVGWVPKAPSSGFMFPFGSPAPVYHHPHPQPVSTHAQLRRYEMNPPAQPLHCVALKSSTNGEPSSQDVNLRLRQQPKEALVTSEGKEKGYSNPKPLSPTLLTRRSTKAR
jgi:hypothetical protein